jgi:hypothetical protein
MVSISNSISAEEAENILEGVVPSSPINKNGVLNSLASLFGTISLEKMVSSSPSVGFSLGGARSCIRLATFE